MDKFKVIVDSSEGSFLGFSDLAIDGGLVHGKDSYYQIVIRRSDGTRYSKVVLENDTNFKLPKFASDYLSTEDPNIFLIEIRTRRESSGLWSKRVKVFVVYREDSENYEIVAIRRES